MIKYLFERYQCGHNDQIINGIGTMHKSLKDNVMRFFKHYAPSMIAKHISRLFNGQIYVHGLGEFRFEGGRLIAPTKAEHEHYKMVKEINSEIARLKTVH